MASRGRSWRSTTKGMHRVCRGEHITFVVPGAMYGPSPFSDRALQPTLFTGTPRAAIRGELTEYANFPLSWPYVEDAPLVDPKRTNDELGITLTPVRVGVEKTLAWLHAQRRI